MSARNQFRKFTSSLLKKFLAVPELNEKIVGTVKNVLIIRQHNQFGDLLASVSLFRAIKENYPDSHITLIASRQNYLAVEKNPLIDEIFIFNNRKIWNPFYAFQLKKILRKDYDLTIVPVTVAVSFTSCILAGISKSKIKIGPRKLNDTTNDLSFIFHHRITLDWRKCPDAHVSDFILDILRPFGIKTKNYNASVFYDDSDKKYAEDFIKTFSHDDSLLIGFHVGAGKTQNRWPLERYVLLIEKINSGNKIRFYFTGSDSDKDELDYMKIYCNYDCGYYLNQSIPRLAALISQSSMFITNDTGVMHVAGTTSTPQISIFGPTNPFNWAPVGYNKYFIRKSELLCDISVDDVYNLFNYILEKHLPKYEQS